MKEKYIKPYIYKEVSIDYNHSILSGSIVEESSEVSSTGHEVIDIDMSNFEYNWE